MGVDEVGISDTTGMANPRQVYGLVSRVTERIPPDKLSLHFHDTRGTALANVLAGLQAGIRIFDGSVGGLGGCPFAQGATGNVATEDLVHMLHEMGIETGVDLKKLIQCAELAEEMVGRRLEGGDQGRAGDQRRCEVLRVMPALAGRTPIRRTRVHPRRSAGLWGEQPLVDGYSPDE
jgi:hydroxymethylglutaryl-CoA lyase